MCGTSRDAVRAIGRTHFLPQAGRSSRIVERGAAHALPSANGRKDCNAAYVICRLPENPGEFGGGVPRSFAGNIGGMAGAAVDAFPRSARPQ